ncbi:hypothetical protein M422DRAFT_250353 [Sphaerobolus stellatus SS14]|uniref:Uncharacterized protein n=1 Tax=Sphaerobolus stellatus (strain SS14) TaxID=990650 RepID=A0A0C9VGZ4_SPHS4|nr:hypothetical protein M422DRAFT_250353 [Sphaerobolus stellatus SS14]
MHDKSNLKSRIQLTSFPLHAPPHAPRSRFFLSHHPLRGEFMVAQGACPWQPLECDFEGSPAPPVFRREEGRTVASPNVLQHLARYDPPPLSRSPLAKPSYTPQ